MADTKTDKTPPKGDEYFWQVRHDSTLIASPRISIPMPSGAKPLPEGKSTAEKPAGQAPKPGKSSS